jgi:apolipoprotein N-acyltransferase
MQSPLLSRLVGRTLSITGTAPTPASSERRPTGRLIGAGLCTLLSAAGCFLSLNLGEAGWLAWIAPIPVLWLAFGPMQTPLVVFLAWLAYALGATNLLEAYAGSLSVPVLLLSIGGPALLFASSALGARLVARRIGPCAGTLAFAALWTAADYLLSFGANGSITSPAYSQTAEPWLIQGASVFGLWVVTFTLAFVSAGLAMSLRRRTFLPAVLAVLLFAANAGFGVWRIEAAATGPTTRIGLGVDDSLGRASFIDRAPVALDAVDAYVGAARRLAAQGASVIVFPEKLAVLRPEWLQQALARLSAAARETRATIIIGFDDRGSDRLNEALIFTPDAPQPQVYLKRHFVPGLEDDFRPGTANRVTSDRIGVVICKDMDFPAMLRNDQQLGHPTLLAVPAYDFDADRSFHARPAIMRGVEDGFAVARAAKAGLLSLTDATGRMIALKRSGSAGMVTLVGDLPRGPGDTIYVHIGDVFAWACLLISVGLLGLTFGKTWQAGPVRTGLQKRPSLAATSRLCRDDPAEQSR